MPRKPKTRQERSKAELLEREVDAIQYGFKARAKRNKKNLPDDWDDFPCASTKDRSWKRKTKKRKPWM